MATVPLQTRTRPTSPVEPETQQPAPRYGPLRRAWRRTAGHRLITAGYLLLSVFLMSGMWADPSGRHQHLNPGDDQVLFEWMLGHTAYALTGGDGFLFSELLNAPHGVNLMANTSVIAIGVVFAPVTWLFGASVSYVLAMTLGMFGTAVAWYYVMHGYLKLSRVAAAVGAGLCAFGPSTVSHANGHLNFTAMVLVPFIVLQILRLREPGRAVRGGIYLGLLLTVQVFIGEEIVFLIAVFMAVFASCYAAIDWPSVRRWIPNYATGLGIAAGISGALVAYPVWFQFNGTQSFHGVPWPSWEFPTDLASYIGYSTDSIVGRLQQPGFNLRHNITEENTFFGLPLLALAIALAVVFSRRSPALRAASLTAGLFALLSLGDRVRIDGETSHVPGPYALVNDLPLFSHTIPTRFALVLLPVIGILVAYGLDRAGELEITARRAWQAAVAVALVPIIPLPVQTAERQPVPEFFTAGSWREYVDDGETLVPVPLPQDVQFDGQRWQIAADYGFAVPLGAFIGPNSEGDAQWSGPRTPTADLISVVMRTGQLPLVGTAERVLATEDLANWRASAVVLGPHEHRAQLLTLMTALLGPGRQVDDVWVWDIDPETGEVTR